VAGIHDVISCAHFGDDRLWDLGCEASLALAYVHATIFNIVFVQDIYLILLKLSWQNESALRRYSWANCHM